MSVRRVVEGRESEPLQPLLWKVANGRGKRKGYTKMTLKVNVKVTTSREVFLYSGLSLLAEIGGYVGLFLGVSAIRVVV